MDRSLEEEEEEEEEGDYGRKARTRNLCRRLMTTWFDNADAEDRTTSPERRVTPAGCLSWDDDGEISL